MLLLYKRLRFRFSLIVFYAMEMKKLHKAVVVAAFRPYLINKYTNTHTPATSNHPRINQFPIQHQCSAANAVYQFRKNWNAMKGFTKSVSGDNYCANKE